MRPILADSSWYISEARAQRDPLRQLGELSRIRDIAVCGLIITEVGRGIIQRSVLKRYLGCWEAMYFVPSDRLVWQETLRLSWEMDRRGHVLPVQDLHIAACALSINAVVLTYDRHFSEIPGIDATERLL